MAPDSKCVLAEARSLSPQTLFTGGYALTAMIRDTEQIPPSSRSAILLSLAIVLIVVAGLLVFPGSIAAKTQIVLHGLCSQRPSHSFVLGGATLPLDARMTGLYIGAVCSLLWLIGSGRLRATRMPSRLVISVLVFFIALLGSDGVNALAFDLGLPHPYQPSNELRLVTGILGGNTVGVVIAWLIGSSLWANPEARQAVVESPLELFPSLVMAATLGMLVVSGLPILFTPFAVGLVVATVFVFSAIGMVALALARGRAWTCYSYGDFLPMMGGGTLLAITIIAELAGMRLMAESAFGLPQ